MKQSQRYVFAAPRSLPSLARAAWAGLFRAARSSERPIGASIPRPRIPRLVRDPMGRHRCVGCELCVDLCPSQSLSLALLGSVETVDVARFELDPGLCIGCGLCAEACPEKAIEMTCAGAMFERPSGSRHVDLLAARA